MHLIVDALPQQPLHKWRIANFLRLCPQRIGMTLIRGPFVTESDDTIIGISIIAESHISVHATPQIVLVDVFSCKDFDYDDARHFILHALCLKETRSMVMPRLIPGHLDMRSLRQPFELPLLP